MTKTPTSARVGTDGRKRIAGGTTINHKREDALSGRDLRESSQVATEGRACT